MSKQAEEKRLVAERLHAEAATKILNQRNNEGDLDIWHLDLHGLHSSEAVAALESRLALLEHGLAEDHMLGVGSSAGPLERGRKDPEVLLERNAKAELRDESDQGQQQGSKQKLFQSLIPSSKLLSIITGEFSVDGVHHRFCEVINLTPRCVLHLWNINILEEKYLETCDLMKYTT